MGSRLPRKQRACTAFICSIEGDDPRKLMLSFTLFERGAACQSLARADRQLSTSHLTSTKARASDLGFNRQLRTLITYLELVSALARTLGHAERQGGLAAIGWTSAIRSGAGARVSESNPRQRASRACSTRQCLRTYSASPYEAFSRRGLHHFENFEPEEHVRVLSVREASSGP